jgi:hypothetical protein
VATIASAALAVATLSCAPSAPPQYPPRPPRCTLEVVKTLPQRPYIELETFTLPSLDSIRAVLDTVQERACHDGADALYAPKAGRSYAYAIALKWSDAPPPSPSPPP